jgi:hypothetical protein
LLFKERVFIFFLLHLVKGKLLLVLGKKQGTIYFLDRILLLLLCIVSKASLSWTKIKANHSEVLEELMIRCFLSQLKGQMQELSMKFRVLVHMIKTKTFGSHARSSPLKVEVTAIQT